MERAQREPKGTRHILEHIDTLYGQEHRQLVTDVEAIIDDHAEAENIVHEAFALLYALYQSQRERLPSPEFFLHRWQTLTRDLADAYQLQQQETEPRADVTDMIERAEAEGEATYDAEELLDGQRALQQLKQALSEDERIIFFGYYVAGRTFADLATRIGTGETQAASIARRAATKFSSAFHDGVLKRANRQPAKTSRRGPRRFLYRKKKQNSAH